MPWQESTSRVVDIQNSICRLGTLTNCGRYLRPRGFDVVTLLDVIEHMSDHEKLVDNVHSVLKVGGRFVVSTDVVDGVSARKPWSWLLPAAGHFSADSRASRLILATLHLIK
jgi:2-polyprenyl-3-methyl-5-hydroxy-6-metoxy-1,4-benzoquinol methylase